MTCRPHLTLQSPFLQCCCSAEDTFIPARGKGIVKTDLSIACPHGTYARVAPRSGLAVKNFIDTGAGVVDEDYRGNVGVVLFNHSDVDFQGENGTRAGIVLQCCWQGSGVHRKDNFSGSVGVIYAQCSLECSLLGCFTLLPNGLLSAAAQGCSSAAVQSRRATVLRS